MMDLKRIEMDKLPNTRDLGGIVTKDNKTIKPNKLLRSGQLFFATSNDIKALKEHDLSLIIDFRSPSEKEEKPDPEIPGVRYAYNPVMKSIAKGITRDTKSNKDTIKMIVVDLADDITKAEAYMEKMYQDLISDDYVLMQYGKFINLLIENGETGASLWHCTAGKDRAGLGTIIVLECLGVDKETIIQDYLLTNKYVKSDVDNMVRSVKKDYDFPLIEEVVGALFGIRREYIEYIYDYINSNFGSFKNFLTEKLNVDKNKINRMKELFLM